MVDNRGKTPPLIPAGKPILEAQCFSQADFVSSKEAVKFVNDEVYSSFRSGVCYEGDIIVTLVGNIGHCAYALDEFAIAQNVVALRLKNEYNNKYFFYYTKTEYFKNKCLQLNRSSVQPSLNVNDFLNLEIDFPEYSVQKEIGNKLFLIDSKISNNISICSTLESMSKLLYDYWFVQFDFPDENGNPYKSSGGKMVWNEELKKEIPEEWEVGCISDFGDVIGGATPSTKKEKYYVEDGIGWITPNDLSNSKNKYISHGERDITQEAVASCSTTIMPKGTVLMSSRAPIGYLAIASDALCTNQGFKSIVPHGYSTEYVYQTLLSMMPYIKSFGVGSTFAEVSKDELSNMKILLPDKKVEQRYAYETKCLGEQIELLEKENQQLSSLRDFLLPMLMNGQVKAGKEDE